MSRDGASTCNDLIARGHAALERTDWDEAYRLFTEAVVQDANGDALDGSAWAAWWRGGVDDVLDARQRAYPELGWLCVHEAEKLLLYAGDVAEARSLGAQAERIGRRCGDVDLEMMGLAMAGHAAVMVGDLDDGTAPLSEAGAAALAEEMSRRWAIYWCVCLVIHACELVRDHDRASPWCRALQDWSARHGLEGFNRSCRAYHAEVSIWRGDWAVAELLAAAEGLTEFRPLWASEAWVRLGGLRRRQGRLDEADALFGRAAGHGLAVLGVGELCLDRNDPAGARDRAHECLRALSGYDRSEEALRLAAQNLASSGLTNVTFHHADAATLEPDACFDFVPAWDGLHDMTDPAAAMRAIRGAIEPDGTWLIVDLAGQSTPEVNHDHSLAGLLYGFSVLDRLGCGTSVEGGMGLGTLGLPEPVARRMTTDAGFTHFTVRDFDSPLSAFYEVRP